MTIDELLTRGVANIIPGKDELKKKLESGKKLNIYFGIDPTNTKIHLGHAVPLRKLQQFADAGHHVTFLIGDYTALIGDTSDKDSERPVLTSEQIEENFQTYKKQAEKILDFSKVEIRHNSEWLSKLGYKDILKLCHEFSVNDFISRELIRKRLDEGKRVALQEVMYPVMQGYDSFMLDTDLQIGGTDQTFNIQAGRTLIQRWKGKESFVMTTPILEGTNGLKMSKTGDNAIWLEDTAEDIYGKVMSIRDDMIVPYAELATNISMAKVEEIKQELTSQNPMNIKKHLAFEIVKELHSEQAAQEAQKKFEGVVQNKELPQHIETIEFSKADMENMTVADMIVEIGMAQSKSQAKQLAMQGGIKINGEEIQNAQLPFFDMKDSEDKALIQVGRKIVYIAVK